MDFTAYAGQARASVLISATVLLSICGHAQQLPKNPSLPDLKIACSNNNVTLSWPLWPLDVYLVAKSDLVAPWSSWAEAPIPEYDEEAKVTIRMSNDHRFFRLTSRWSFFRTGEYTMPLCWYAIFAAVDLEMNPALPMTISGSVHCNSNVYTVPASVLTFQKRVTVVGSLYSTGSPQDPFPASTNGSVVYEGGRRCGCPLVNVPIGTNATEAAIRQVVEIPPASESAVSELGRIRLYNIADMVVIVSDTGISANTGLADGFRVNIPFAQLTQFVKTNVIFFNKREGKTIKATQIDIASLLTWNATNTVYGGLFGSTRNIRVIYIADQRAQSSNTQSGVRLVNGRTLLPQGLTVATPNPLYVKGDYNVPVSDVGTTNTSGTLPAALLADAITLLSANWLDFNSTGPLSIRPARDTTVNAALIAGNVLSNGTNSSGGIENFIRLLEDWSTRTLTLNGSLGLMFHSRFATGAWLGSGASVGVYNPPARKWSFDTNFLDPSKLPPGTPIVVVAPTN